MTNKYNINTIKRKIIARSHIEFDLFNPVHHISATYNNISVSLYVDHIQYLINGIKKFL